MPRPGAGGRGWLAVAAVAVPALAGWAGPACAAELPIDIVVAQAGAESGIRTHLFTRWVPGGMAVAGVAGRIGLRGNAPGFDEALVEVGVAAGDRAGCLRRDGAAVDAVPVLDRLWAGILKSDGAPAGLTVDVRLPVAAAVPVGGGCLTTVVSAGYAFLRRDAALYASASARLVARLVPGGAAVQGFGIGGEARLATGGAVPMATYVGLRAKRALVVDGLAASVSAAAVAGAPAGSGWVVPAGAWRVETIFAWMPAEACRVAHFAGHAAGADFDVLRGPGPVAMVPPAAGVMLRLDTAGRGGEAAQGGGFAGAGDAGWHGRLEAGACLVAWQSVPAGGAAGTLDVENQSTLYLRVAPGG